MPNREICPLSFCIQLIFIRDSESVGFTEPAHLQDEQQTTTGSV